MRIVFLDRDGVINEFPGHRNYVTSWEEFSFIPGSIEAICLLKEHGFKVYVASNQAGVAKGLYSHKDLECINKNMLKEIRGWGGDLDDIFYCFHRDEDDCDCRKPKPGLLTRVLDNLEQKPKDCFFIGDSLRDVKAARNAGCKSVLVLSGSESAKNRENWEIKPDYVFDDLFEAVRKICLSYE